MTFPVVNIIMTSEILVRPFKDSDQSTLAEMYCRLNTETFTWMPARSFSIEDFNKDTMGEDILVASLNGRLLGFVSVLSAESLIHHLYVDSKTQGQGLGKLLLDSGIQFINKNPVYLNCRAKNERALNFYKKYGFKIDSKTEGPPDAYYSLKFQA